MDGDGGTRRDAEERRDTEESGESIDLQELPDADEGYDYLDNGSTLSDMKEEVDRAAEAGDDGGDDDVEVTKAHVTKFAEGLSNGLSPRSNPEAGDAWDGERPGEFVELGWLDLNHNVTTKGAAVLDTAAAVMSDTGGGLSGLRAYLNGEGLGGFFDRVAGEHGVEFDVDV